MDTNAPKMVTVLVAIALTIVGLSVTILPIDFVNDLLTQADVRLTAEQGYWFLVASPVLLAVASFVKGL